MELNRHVAVVLLLIFFGVQTDAQRIVAVTRIDTTVFASSEIQQFASNSFEECTFIVFDLGWLSCDAVSFTSQLCTCVALGAITPCNFNFVSAIGSTVAISSDLDDICDSVLTAQQNTALTNIAAQTTTTTTTAAPTTTTTAAPTTTTTTTTPAPTTTTTTTAAPTTTTAAPTTTTTTPAPTTTTTSAPTTTTTSATTTTTTPATTSTTTSATTSTSTTTTPSPAA